MSNFTTSIPYSLDRPQLPNGMASLFPKHGIWNSIGQLSGVSQMVLGLVIFATSSLYLSNTVQFSGQLIGVVSMLLGVIGVLGLRMKRPAIQMLFIVGMGFIAMMTFEFTVQVGRDVDTHCSFAEAYTRLAHLEEMMVSMRHDDMAMQLFSRLNEMDDMLDMVKEGNIEKFELDSRSKDIMHQDISYITQKIEMLRHHADDVMKHLSEEEEKAEAEKQAAKDPKTKKKQQAIQSAIRHQMEQVDTLLEGLDKKVEDGEGITFDDYERIFSSLLGGHSGSLTLNQEKEHLPFLRAAWDRYSTGYASGESKEMQSIERHRAEQRHLFEEMFHQTMTSHRETGPPAFHERLTESLDDLPEQCLRENKHLFYFVWGGWLLIVAQMATAYVSATSLAVESMKKDF